MELNAFADGGGGSDQGRYHEIFHRKMERRDRNWNPMMPMVTSITFYNKQNSKIEFVV